MSAIHAVPVMTPAERRKRARALAPSYTLYYAGDEWFCAEKSGIPWWFRPDLNGAEVEHPALPIGPDGKKGTVIANGITDVRDLYGVIYGKKAVPINGFWALPVLQRDAPLEEERADKVVEFFVKRYGNVGIVELIGDPVQDEAAKKYARQMWLEARKVWAQNERKARADRIEAYKKENPGTTSLPPMTPAQIKAEHILDTIQSLSAKSAYQYVCECGFKETNDKAEFDDHVQKRHGKKEESKSTADLQKIVADLMASNLALQAQVSELANKRGPGRPRKEETKDTEE